MIRVSVTSTDVRTQSGTAKASGKPYSLDFQTVWFHTVDRAGNLNPYPEKAEIILDKDDQARPKVYAVGEYTLAPASLYISRNGDLAISPKLKPIQAAK